MRLILAAVSLAVTSTAWAQLLEPDPSYKHAPLALYDATGRLFSGAAADPSQMSNQFLVATLRYSPTKLRPGDRIGLRLQPVLAAGKLRYTWSETEEHRFFYESTDCSGQPLVLPGQNLPGRRAAVIDWPSNTLYVSAADPSFSLREYHSLRYSGQVCQENAGPGNINSTPVEAALDLDDYFTLPFELR